MKKILIPILDDSKGDIFICEDGDNRKVYWVRYSPVSPQWYNGERKCSNCGMLSKWGYNTALDSPDVFYCDDCIELKEEISE